MSVLRLRIASRIDREGSFAVGELLDRDARTVRQLTIPVGGRGWPLELELEPGPYLVRAVLPSGRRIAEQVQVAEGNKPTIADLDAGGEGDGSLEFGPLAASSRRLMRLIDAFHPPPARPGVEELRDGGVRQSVRLGRYVFKRVDLELELVVVDVAGRASSSYPLNASGGKDIVERAPLRCEVHTYHAGLVHAVRFASEVHDVSRWPRVFLSARRGRFRQFVAVPTPWYSREPRYDEHEVAGHSQCIIDVMIAPLGAQSKQLRNPSSPRVVTSVEVRDRVFGAGLAFLAAGESGYAQRIVDDAKQREEIESLATRMLFHKKVNPFAAAAGGYILARSQEGEASNEWIEWTRNLMNWFPSLPDGAILHGWFQLKLLHDAEQARICFGKAMSRGVPVFTEGLRMLSEGLTQLRREDKQPEATEELLLKVRAYAVASDPRQVFATFYGNAPDDPQLPPRRGPFSLYSRRE